MSRNTAGNAHEPPAPQARQDALFHGTLHLGPGEPCVCLGLDFGRSFGFGVIHVEIDGSIVRIESGVLGLPSHHGRRNSEVVGLISRLNRKHGLQVIAFEQVTFQQGQDWAALYYAQLGLVELVAHKQRLPAPVPVPVRDAKIRATGDPKATKGDMMLAMERAFGCTITEDHEADALAVAVEGAHRWRTSTA